MAARGPADERAQGGQFGPYRLVKQIATGGMAEIHLAKTRGIEGFEKYVALKMIHPNFSSDDHFIQMLIDEAKISVQLTHVNIAQTFDLGRVGDTYYIAMEFVDGNDLFRVLRKSSELDRYMPIETAVWIAKEVASGLDYAHNKRDMAGRSLGIIHRDVSPQNVLISHTGEVKIVDFGIAKATMRAKQTAVGVIKGKYYYMSPEQAWGDKLDHRTDIFSAGILLYEMLTGQMLYLEENMTRLLDMVRKADIPPPSSKRSGLPRELDRIVMRALAKKPDSRWQTSHDYGVELEKFLHSYAPDFTAQKLAGFIGEVMGPGPAPGPKVAPAPAEPDPDHLPRQSIAASRSEFTDDHSIIFDPNEKVAPPPRPSAPPPPRAPISPNRMTTPASLPPPRRPVMPDRVTTPSGALHLPPEKHEKPPEKVPVSPPGQALGKQGLASRLAGAPTHDVAISELSARAKPQPPAKLPVQHTVDISDEDLEELEADEMDSPAAATIPSPAPVVATAPTPRPVAHAQEGSVDQPTTVDGPRGALKVAAKTAAAPPDEEPTKIDVAGLSGHRRSSRNLPAQPAPPPAAASRPPAPRPTRRTPGSVPAQTAEPPAEAPRAAEAPQALPLSPPVTGEHPLAPPLTTPASSQSAAVIWPPQAGDESMDDFFGVKIAGFHISARQVLLALFALAGLVGIGALLVAVLSGPRERQFATLEIISIPSGGKVSVDGKTMGVTPVGLERVPLGRKLVLRVELERHETWQREETFEEARPVKVVASMKPILGSLTVESNPLGAEVFVNNRSLGTTPLEQELSPFDDGFVEVRKQGYKPSRQPLEWKGQRKLALKFELVPAKE